MLLNLNKESENEEMQCQTQKKVYSMEKIQNNKQKCSRKKKQGGNGCFIYCPKGSDRKYHVERKT